MNATWRTSRTLCRELDWSKSRLLYELQNGWPYRTIPPGHVIDWHRARARRSLNVEDSTVDVLVGAAGNLKRLTVNIEVSLPPEDAEVSSPPADAPAASPAPPRNVSPAEVERRFREIRAERPDDPPNEKDLLAELKKRLGAPPGRQRVRDLWKRIAPQWKRPVGAPRNKISAKKSAE